MKKATKTEIEQIRQRLLERYSGAVTELHYRSLYELVVAVALSAQCTDKRVNLITPALFEKYPDPQTLAAADVDDVKALINTCSFFNNYLESLIDELFRNFRRNGNACFPLLRFFKNTNGHI